MQEKVPTDRQTDRQTAFRLYIHFEQIWRRSELKPRRKMRAGKVPTDRQTDRQTAFRLYIVDINSAYNYIHINSAYLWYVACTVTYIVTEIITSNYVQDKAN